MFCDFSDVSCYSSLVMHTSAFSSFIVYPGWGRTLLISYNNKRKFQKYSCSMYFSWKYSRILKLGSDWTVENGGNWLNSGKWWKLTEQWKMVKYMNFCQNDWMVEHSGNQKNWLNGSIWWKLTEWSNMVETDWMLENWLNGWITYMWWFKLI